MHALSFGAVHFSGHILWSDAEGGALLSRCLTAAAVGFVDVVL